MDYIISHTAPREIIRRMGYYPDAHDMELTGFLEWVMYECDFKHWYFGHWHEDKDVGDDFTALYPLVTWKHQKKTYMIHGHIHNDTESDYWHLLCANQRILNAGVDINGFEPVTLEELIKNNNVFKYNHNSVH